MTQHDTDMPREVAPGSSQVDIRAGSWRRNGSAGAKCRKRLVIGGRGSREVVSSGEDKMCKNQVLKGWQVGSTERNPVWQVQVGRNEGRGDGGQAGPHQPRRALVHLPGAATPLCLQSPWL